MKKILALKLIFISTFSWGEETPREQHIETTPDLAEILMDVDQKVPGYRAGASEMAVNLSLDPLMNGRLAVDYAFKLNSRLNLIFPVSFQHTALLLPFRITSNNRIIEQWDLLAGAGAKFRLSEWMQKSSFYVQLLAQVGVYAQEALGLADTRYAVRIRPSLYLGWERVFETGLVFGAKVGVEKNWNIPTSTLLAFAESNWNFSPAVNIGFSW